MTAVGYAEWAAAVGKAGLGVAPAELHGAIAGYLCAGRGGRAHEVLAALALERDEREASGDLQRRVDAVVADVARAWRADGTIAPLLPAGPLPARADAMVDWCRGFLGGIGLAGIAGAAEPAPGLRDWLDDLGHIAARHLQCDDDDAAALADVLTFVEDTVRRIHAASAPQVPQ